MFAFGKFNVIDFVIVLIPALKVAVGTVVAPIPELFIICDETPQPAVKPYPALATSTTLNVVLKSVPP